MGLDITLCRVLTKRRVTNLLKKYNDDITLYSMYDGDAPKELRGIHFIDINTLVSCECNIGFLQKYKDCLVKRIELYENPVAILLKYNKVTKEKLNEYQVMGYYPLEENDGWKLEFCHKNNENDKFIIIVKRDEVDGLEFINEEYGIYIQDIRYLQRKGLKNWEALAGKEYTDYKGDIFLFNNEQLKELKKANHSKGYAIETLENLGKYEVINLNW